MAQKRYLFTPGPTPVPPQVLAAMAEPVHPPPGAGLPRGLRALLERLRRSPDRAGGAALHLLRDGRVRVGDRQPLLAGRAACSPSPPAPSATAGRDGEGVRRRRRGAPLRVGRDADAEDLRAKLARSTRRRLVFLVHRRPRPASSPTSRRSPRSRRTPARSSSSTPSRASAPCRSRWTSGASTSSSPGSQKALMTPPGLATAAVSAAAWEQVERSTLPRFYFDWRAHAQGAGAGRRRVHAGRLARSSRSTSRSGCCSTTGLEDAFERHAALGRACRARASRRWASSCSRRTRSAPPSSPPSATPDGIDSDELAARCATGTASRSPAARAS